MGFRSRYGLSSISPLRPQGRCLTEIHKKSELLIGMENRLDGGKRSLGNGHGEPKMHPRRAPK